LPIGWRERAAHWSEETSDELLGSIRSSPGTQSRDSILTVEQTGREALADMRRLTPGIDLVGYRVIELTRPISHGLDAYGLT
jgi:hypothetical protein